MSTAPKFKLERVDANDPQTWAILVQMDHDCFNNNAPPLTDNTGEWWIAYAGEEPAGFAAIRPAGSDPKRGAYLSRSGVLPRFRGCGLQKVMIRRRLAWAKRAAFSYVITDTMGNPASANSLIACGFRMYTPPYKWSFEDACYWRKFLVEAKA